MTFVLVIWVQQTKFGLDIFGYCHYAREIHILLSRSTGFLGTPRGSTLKCELYLYVILSGCIGCDGSWSVGM